MKKQNQSHYLNTGGGVSFEAARANEPRLDQVEFTVDADAFATETVWKMWHERVSWDFLTKLPVCIYLGTIDNRPVTVDVRLAAINGHIVMFYCGSSQLIDHALIDRWLDGFAHCNAGGSRPGSCEASTFSQCIYHCRETR